MADPTYDFVPTTPVGQVRLLVNDVAAPWMFSDEEITAFLAMEGDNVKRAAAQAIDTNADNEVLASKVLKSQDLSTDGAKVADALHKRATDLRAQALADDELADDFYFDVVNLDELAGRPELTEWPL